MARVIMNIEFNLCELAYGVRAIVEEGTQFRGYRWKYFTLKLQRKSAISFLFYEQMGLVLALGPELGTLQRVSQTIDQVSVIATFK